MNASRREWLPSRQYRENSEMTNENPVVSAVTGFDDDKLIHKSKLVFDTVLNGPFNRSIFIVCRASALLSRGVSFSPTVEIIHREKRIFSAVRRGKKKVMNKNGLHDVNTVDTIVIAYYSSSKLKSPSPNSIYWVIFRPVHTHIQEYCAYSTSGDFCLLCFWILSEETSHSILG